MPANSAPQGPPRYWSQLIPWLYQQLPLPPESPAESRFILEALGLDRMQIKLFPERELLPEQRQRLVEIVARRRQREPLQYILGQAYFRHLCLNVSPDVLIPRPETEELVELVLPYLTVGDGVADIGTGSGAIALSLATEFKGINVHATDISEEALNIARHNAQTCLKAEASELHFYQGDGLAALTQKDYAVIVSNPPYVPYADWQKLAPEVLNHEPQLALTPGPEDPLIFYRHFASEGPRYLKAGGMMALELDTHWAEATRELFLQKPWENAQLQCDLQGNWRFLRAFLAS